jgi:hypothetical protein
LTPEVVWEPNPGSQVAFLTCPVFEVLLEGTRGGGKTDSLLMDFGQHVGQGFGAAWRGILFRETHPQLADVIAKSQKWFPRIWPQARFLESNDKLCWVWPSGETLFFRHFKYEKDYWNYHGHEYPWIAWEELCNWPDLNGYKRMMSCCRSSHKDVPRKYRSTTNPYGPGHNAVKFRFRLPGWRYRVIEDAVDEEGRPEPHRVAIHSHINENQVILQADPQYISRLVASARNEAERKAWMEGSWDIVAGGMFDDVYSKANVLPAGVRPPAGWRVDRAFDWGSSKPFSVGWYMQSDGSDLVLPDNRVMSTIRGDLIRFREWYGWNGKPNEGSHMLNVDIARGIVEREVQWGLRNAQGFNSRVVGGPADSSIYAVENGVSPALDMERQVRLGNLLVPGVSWEPADKRPGSRKAGWQKTREMLSDVRGEVLRRDGKPLLDQDGREIRRPRERPGLFVTADCDHFIRTVPVLPRDDKDMDDVDTDAEDHVGDEVRYRVRRVGSEARTGQTVGLY